ncbi:putative amino-acid ABC transporter ATP-binding protein YecC, partial [Salmonella enterica subsp. enterica serovar Heidelberg str. N19992]
HLCRLDKAPVNCAAIRQWTGHYVKKSPYIRTSSFLNMAVRGGLTRCARPSGSLLASSSSVQLAVPVVQVLNTIRQLAQEKRTMVIVTHEMGFARDVADRAIFMDQGQIVEQGPAKTLFADPQHPRTRQFLEKFLVK